MARAVNVVYYTLYRWCIGREAVMTPSFLTRVRLLFGYFRRRMKRRGGGGGGAASAPSNVVESDVDDRTLSEEASRRAASKAAAEAAGQRPSAAAAQPLPIGLIVAAVSVLCAMLYLTIFSV